MWKRWGVPVVMLAGMIVWTGCGWNMKEERREKELSAKSIETLKVDAGSGDLTIKGDDKATSIHAVAVIKSSDGLKDESIVFTLEPDGKSAKLVSKLKPSIGFNNRTMDVTVTVPANMNLDVEDDSGDISITDIRGNVNIDDDSGDIALQHIQGKLDIEDESGAIELSDVIGDASVDDESGDIVIRDHTGNVSLKDESGEIRVTNVKGGVTVEDGSGDINIRGVDGDVTILSDGSGGAKVEEVKGKYSKK
ncbi:DUF4097 domain-containing protein [Paenibacillus mesophilus]|uniref:DUF4097 family beta strand repeat-containing protein n=1 Tax=Paenibacillus mesophilus TaxID=2582849 RepID=UPI00110D5E2E|nr:DUF4097 family beta strand repeat-containing protein [Paenibacillus mesophilus]TMV48081.1 DUF4097 domain-containing protein [Paenibacillus mesophilus]